MLPGALVKQLREKQSLSVNSWQRFWWPNVDTPENAASAAKNGGVAFGFIALGYAIATLFAGTGVRNPSQPSATESPQLFIWINIVIFAVAAILAWRTYKKPSLLLCVVALAWVLIEFAGKAASVGLPSNVIGAYWGQILGTLAGLGGVRGAWAARRYRQLSEPSGA